MSYIGLLNESHMTTYTNVSASDDLTVGTSLRNLGSLSQTGAATFSGSLFGLSHIGINTKHLRKRKKIIIFNI